MIQFQASLPETGGMKVNRDGMVIRLDIPETDIAEAMKLTLMRSKVLIVTIKVEGE